MTYFFPRKKKKKEAIYLSAIVCKRFLVARKVFKQLEKMKHLGNKSYCFLGNSGGQRAISQLSQLFLNMYCLLKSMEILFLISNLQRKEHKLFIKNLLLSREKDKQTTQIHIRGGDRQTHKWGGEIFIQNNIQISFKTFNETTCTS